MQVAPSTPSARKIQLDGFTYFTTAPERDMSPTLAHYELLASDAQREAQAGR